MHDTTSEVLRILTALGVSSSPLEPNTELTQLGIDSLKFIDIVLGIEKHFGITFSSETMVPESFRSPSTIAASVEKHR
ncbi:acyl carrier protein [Neorhizobium sp. BETTINA12A]|uniref:acyl carrier protein n=1 Tax=Neorhizobium sp. BETTINA12A TaxID=2908924 RepID=UPI001FF2B1CB|nr:acyl carrier protein [Neorhizobium sp. BETTINA12A]MCJ9750403.1 acyl carrier protein [Neorhizobium sp. BETTINA12A]